MLTYHIRTNKGVSIICHDKDSVRRWTEYIIQRGETYTLEVIQ